MTDDEIIQNKLPIIDWNPKYDGRYCLGGKVGFCVMLTKKPCWIKRKMMQWCFGWEWVDN